MSPSPFVKGLAQRLFTSSSTINSLINHYLPLPGKTRFPNHDIDVVIPIPDTSRTSALQAAYVLDIPFREGFIKNRYIARTFIMPGQTARKKSVRLKLNTIKSEFAGKNVLLVDDSVVRGTTAREIVSMARDAGARRVYFTSAAPPIRYPNIYGIDIPTTRELVAHERNEQEVAEHIGCEWIVYQTIEDLEDCVRKCGGDEGVKEIEQFDTSCFSGNYVTGEKLTDPYFSFLHEARNDDAKQGVAPRRGSNDENVEELILGVPNLNVNERGPGERSPRKSSCESIGNDERSADYGSCRRGCEGLENDTRVGWDC